VASIREQMGPPGDLLGQASRRSRDSARVRVQRLRTASLPILQCALAAGLAWLVAKHVVHHGSPFFAPVAAIITLGLTLGQRGRRAYELAAGVALGIGVGDLLVFVIGTGWWQIAVVVALAMSAAVLVGGSSLFINQSAVSAVLVTTIQVPTDGIDPSRWLDALIGTAFALLINAIVPTDPLRLVKRQIEPVLTELAGALDDTAEAIADDDRDAAAKALTRARNIDPLMGRYREALGVARETLSLAPLRRRMRPQLAPYETASSGLDNAVRNTRVLARGAIRAVELDEHVPPLAVAAIGELAAAVRALELELADPHRGSEAEDAALRAAARSTAALEVTTNLSSSVIVGQVRSTAVDLLRGMGMEGDEARSAVRDARARLGV
jgi:uncharacterized membrane protein YgaE (UPF0421/DUF939 family)